MQSEQRLHPLSFLFAIASNIRASLIPILLAVFAAQAMNAFLAVFILPGMVWAFVRYLSYRYVFAEDDLVIRTGFLFRNERHIPYQRIHNINAIQSVLHRIFGVAEVRIETAGGQEAEAKLQVLSLRAMEEMRQRVLREKGQTALTGEFLDQAGQSEREGETPANQPRTLLHLPLRELVVHGITQNRGMVVVGAATGLAWELGLYERFGSELPSVREMAPSLTEAGFLVVAVGLLFLVLLRLLSISLAIVKLYDFKLRKTGRDLTLEGGLLTRFATTIPLHRIQIISIVEKPLQRIFDRAEVRVQTVSGGDESQEKVLGSQHLAPLIRVDKLPQLLTEVHPEVDLERIEWRPVDPRAKRRILRLNLLGVAALSALSAIYLGWWATLLLALLSPLALLDAHLQFKHMGYACESGLVLFKSGWIWRKISLARTSKIQSVSMAQSPFDRRYRMSRLKMDTAGAGQTGHNLDIPYLDWDVAFDLYKSLGTEAAHTAFRW